MVDYLHPDYNFVREIENDLVILSKPICAIIRKTENEFSRQVEELWSLPPSITHGDFIHNSANFRGLSYSMFDAIQVYADFSDIPDELPERLIPELVSHYRAKYEAIDPNNLGELIAADHVEPIKDVIYQNLKLIDMLEEINSISTELHKTSR
ncbi:MAG: hypothetical protein ACE5FT_04135 [Candidatus Nanoarchaeia archaeon]